MSFFKLQIFTLWILLVCKSYSNTLVNVQNMYRSVIANENTTSRLKHNDKTERRVLSVRDITKLYETKMVEVLTLMKQYLLEIKHESQTLEEHHRYQTFKDEIHYKSRANNSLPVQTHIRFSLKTEVNMDASFVQVPTKLYNQHTKLLNDIKWTDDLDELFAMQLKKQALITWQYIGFTNGASRMYPGSHLQK